VVVLAATTSVVALLRLWGIVQWWRWARLLGLRQLLKEGAAEPAATPIRPWQPSPDRLHLVAAFAVMAAATWATDEAAPAATPIELLVAYVVCQLNRCWP
jgi:hypothetical protein